VQNSAGTSILFVSGSGNVGIGITNPTLYRLDVVGQIKSRNLASGDTTGITLGNNGSERARIQFTASDDSARFKLEVLGVNGATERLSVFAGPIGGVASNEALVIGGNGNIGIGTGALITARLLVSGSGATSSTTTAHFVNSSGTSLLFVRDDGRVGIGTSAPQAAFHVVNGSVPNAANLYIGYVGSNNYYDANQHYYRDGSGNIRLTISSTGNVTPGADATQDLGSSSLRWRNVFAANISGSLTGSNLTAGQVVVAGTGGVLSGSNNFWWNNSANQVGIGTSSPTNTLDVRGTLGIGGGATYGNGLTVTSTNTSAANHTHYIRGPAAGTNDDVYFDLNRGGGAYGSFNVNFGSSTIFGVSGGALRYNGNILLSPVSNVQQTVGKFSIGGPSPVSRFEVTGSGATSSTSTMHLVNGSNSTLLFVRDDGNVGIGTSSPGYRLDVTGNTQLYGNLLVGNTVTGGSTARFTTHQDRALTIKSNISSTVKITAINPLSSDTLRELTLEGSPVTIYTGATSGASGTEAVRIDASGNVGIGTSSPTVGFRLDVRGAGRIEVADPRIDLVGTYRGFMAQVVDAGSAAASYWRLYDLTAAANRVIVDSSGNVGIGTIGLDSRLVVAGNSVFSGSANPSADLTYDLGSSTKRWRNVYASSISGSITGSNLTAGQVVVAGAGGLLSGSNNFWWSNSNGRVGIGTSSPAVALDVAVGPINVGTPNGAGGSAKLVVADSSTDTSSYGLGARIAIQNNSATDGNFSSLSFVTSNAEDAAAIWSVIRAHASAQGDLVFGTSEDGGATERMRIDSAGNVGIGTSVMDYSSRLVVAGNSVFSGSVNPDGDLTRDLGSSTKRWRNLYAGNISGSLTGSNLTAGQVVVAGTGGLLSGSNNFWWSNSNGRVGIGTSSPTAFLTVQVPNAASTNVRIGEVFANYAGITLNGSTTDNDYNILSRATDQNLYINRPTGNIIHFREGNTNQVAIASGGNVGIGTATPTARLHINGSIGTTTHTLYARENQASASGTAVMWLQNSAGANLLFVSGSGNVGIGTSAPAFNLEVAGTFAAATKSFVIPHPIRPGWKLRYGSLEGPENGIYVRGASQSEVIDLPDYWEPLVDPASIAVQLTPIGKWQSLYVESIENNRVKIGRGWFMRLFGIKPNYFYMVNGARRDATFDVEYVP